MNPRIARNGQQFHSRLLRAARAHHSQKDVGEAVGWDASKTSRVLSGEVPVPLDEALAFVAAAGMALIEAPDGDTVTVSATHYQALLALAGERMADLQGNAGRAG